MPLPRKKDALAVLPRKKLLCIARQFNVDVRRSHKKEQLLAALAKSRSASFSRILDTLTVPELKEICRAHDLAHSASRHEILKVSIMGSRKRHSSNRPAAPESTGLRPFFGYYGGKWRDTPKHYPAPLHDTIIEPFAGSAGYSLRYANRKVILVERDPILVAVWQYLFSATEQEILDLPDLAPDQSVDDLDVSQSAKWLIGFWLNRGVEAPRKRPSKWMRDGIRPGSFWGVRVRQTIASQVGQIRHWKIRQGDYSSCSVLKSATWFIDPPYQYAGQHYRFGSRHIDYKQLGRWCIERSGQVIVCENEGADWLPFEHLSDIKTTRRNQRCREVIWTQSSEAFVPIASCDSDLDTDAC